MNFLKIITLVVALSSVIVILLLYRGIGGVPLLFLAESERDLDIQLLSPAIISTGGPKGTAVLFHGCAGDKDPNHQTDWASYLAAEGWKAYEVNSFRRRGISSEFAHRRICRGHWMWGQRRSQDVELGLSTIDLSGENDIVLGWSHGAWAILELLDRDRELLGIEGLILFYPYCGRFATPGQYFPSDLPVLVVQASNDDYVNNQDCVPSFSGRENVSVITIDGTHGFDIRDAPRRFSEDATEVAKASISAWLTKEFGEFPS